MSGQVSLLADAVQCSAVHVECLFASSFTYTVLSGFMIHTPRTLAHRHTSEPFFTGVSCSTDVHPSCTCLRPRGEPIGGMSVGRCPKKIRNKRRREVVGQRGLSFDWLEAAERRGCFAQERLWGARPHLHSFILLFALR